MSPKNSKEIISEKFVLLLEKSLSLRALFNRTPGVTLAKREIPIIVSLTSWERRLEKVYLSIESLLRQSIKPDYIFLWLSDKIESLPDSLEKTRLRGVDIFLGAILARIKKRFIC